MFVNIFHDAQTQFIFSNCVLYIKNSHVMLNKYCTEIYKSELFLCTQKKTNWISFDKKCAVIINFVVFVNRKNCHL